MSLPAWLRFLPFQPLSFATVLSTSGWKSILLKRAVVRGRPKYLIGKWDCLADSCPKMVAIFKPARWIGTPWTCENLSSVQLLPQIRWVARLGQTPHFALALGTMPHHPHTSRFECLVFGLWFYWGTCINNGNKLQKKNGNGISKESIKCWEFYIIRLSYM